VPRALPLNPTPGRYRGGKTIMTDQPRSLSKRLNFRIDEATYSAFEAKVSAANLTRSEFFRDIVLNNKTQVIARKITTDHTKQALFLINKTSNNINQLAKAANTAQQSGKITDKLYISLLESLDQQNQLLQAFLEHVN
jgi:hypothetical protein